MGSKAVALLERLHLQPVHLVNDAVELVLQLRIAFDVDAAGEHQIDSAIELGLGLSELALAIVFIAG